MRSMARKFLVVALSYLVIGSTAQFGLFGSKAPAHPSDFDKSLNTNYAPDKENPTVSDETKAAVKLIETEFEAIIGAPQCQQFIAAITFALGVAALYDGLFFFKKIVVLLAAAITFCFALVLLDSNASGPLPPLAKYVTALEISLAVGWATFVGWKGAQFVLGLIGGVWLFKALDVLATLVMAEASVNNFDIHTNNGYIILTRTIGLGLGFVAVHERGGGKRFFGLLAPILGASLVVAACGYSMLFLTSKVPSLQKAFGVEVAKDAVAPVWQFWRMIVHPYSAKAVGIFELKGDDFTLDNRQIQPDRIIATVFWIILSYVGIRFQCSQKKEKVAPSLEQSLLQVYKK